MFQSISRRKTHLYDPLLSGHYLIDYVGVMHIQHHIRLNFLEDYGLLTMNYMLRNVIILYSYIVSIALQMKKRVWRQV